MTKLGRLHISDEVRAVKPWFDDRPSDAIVREIKKFIAAELKPYLWRGHTHTKPPTGAVVVYLDEFCVPVRNRQNKALWAPCPCCSDDVPKYIGSDRNAAKIAWFPEERVIRLIGPDCFAALNEAGHADALIELRKMQSRKKHERFLFDNLGMVHEALLAINQNLEIAIALEKFRDQLLSKLAVLPRFRLFEELREGKLRTTEVLIKTTVRPGKPDKVTRKEFEKVYATISGHELLRLQRSSPAAILSRAEELLSKIDISINLIDALDGEIAKVSRNFARALKTAREAAAEIEKLRRFLSVETINTLRTWGKRPDANLKLFVDLVGDNFYIGPSDNEKIRVEVSPIIFDQLNKIPVPGSGSSVDVVARDVA